MKKLLFILILSLASLMGQAQTYYVQDVADNINASDSNAGTDINFPWATPQKAFDTATPGSTVYFRGSTWYPTSTTFQAATYIIDPNGEYHLGTPHGYSGTAANPIVYTNYPGESPVFDLRHIAPPGNYLECISMFSAHHITIRGIEIRNIWSHGISGVRIQAISSATSSYRTFENLKVHDLSGRGFGFSGIPSYVEYGIVSDTSRMINCDIYNCADTLMTHPFNLADGVKSDVEAGAVFIFDGCRFWNISDDGLDVSGSGQKIVRNCWAFEVGVNFDGVGGFPVDDGNGFKLGGVRDTVEHNNFIMENCISAGNLRYGLHLLDYTPYYRDNGRVRNCVFYGNEIGISSFGNSSKPWQDTEFYNTISWGNTDREVTIAFPYPIYNSSWLFQDASINYVTNPAYNITSADFVSLDTELLKAPRNADGSLPDVNFMKLVSGSDLIDGGIDVGLYYNGTAPDVGVFEYDDGSPYAEITVLTTEYFAVGQTINLSAANSTDDGTIVSYAWDFGDTNTSTGVSTSHAYSTNGYFNVTLTVTDNLGNEGIVTDSLLILGNNPVANFYLAPPPPYSSVADVLGFNPLHSKDDKNDIVSYAWNFGNGDTSTDEFAAYQYPAPGDYSVVLMLTDGDANTGTYTRDIHVNSNPPNATFTYSPYTPVEVNTPIQFDASGSTDDVGIVSYSWNYGNNDDGTGVNPVYTFTQTGSYTVQVTVEDADGQTDGFYRVINVIDAPTGSLITNMTELQAALANDAVIQLSGNSFSGDLTIAASNVSITAANGYTPVFSGNITVTGSGADLSNLTFSGNLSLSLSQSPSVTYCTFTGSGEKMTLAFPPNDWEGNTWIIDYNDYTNMSSSATINGYRKSLWQALFKGKFDSNSTF